MSTSAAPSARQPRVASGQFTYAHHDQAAPGLLSKADAADEARQVFADAKDRATQATGHARRAGVNLLTLLAQARDTRAANLNLRWQDGRYAAETVTDRAGDVVWSAADDAGDPINRTVHEVGAYIEEPGDAADAGVRVLPDGVAVLPLAPSEHAVLGDLDRLLS